MYVITGLILVPTIHLAILNVCIDNVTYPLCTEVTHVLVAARLTITKNWKAQYDNPSEVVALTKLHHSYEHTLADWSRQELNKEPINKTVEYIVP